MTGYIYLIENIINGKIYIGQTTKTVAERVAEHLKDTSPCIRIRNALKKYGIKNFKIIILHKISADSKNDLKIRLNELEYLEIRNKNSISPNGYNLKSGGNTFALSAESIKKRANSHKKRIICNETQQQWPSAVDAAKEFGVKPKFIGRVLRGERKHFKGMSFSYIDEGKPIPQEFLDARLMDRRGKTLNKEQKRQIAKNQMKAIKCNENGIEYQSISYAAEILGIGKSGIHKVLNGSRKRVANLTFSYCPKQS